MLGGGFCVWSVRENLTDIWMKAKKKKKEKRQR
jgi:hypothetical protein